MSYRPILISLCWLILVTTGCKTTRSGLENPRNGLEEIIKDNTLFSENHSGIYVESLENEDIIYQQFADHRFIPASNIKILTLYAAIKTLNGSIPSFQYFTNKDTLWIQGTGDPAFLYDQVNQDTTFISFIESREEATIIFSQTNFMDARFGAGWAWDDYAYAFQVEKSPFPIYGNRVTFFNSARGDITVSPPYFKRDYVLDPTLKYGRMIRSETNNHFRLAPDLSNRKFKSTRPFTYQSDLIAQLLSDTLNRSIQFDTLQRSLPKNKVVVERTLSDELYQRMMQESDNFIAEQLLLALGGTLMDTLNTQLTIKQLEKRLFLEIARDIRWVDGSGLSRYNLLTPRSITFVLRNLYRDISTDRLTNIFPAGGVSGSLKEWYGGKNGPYVFAKTGSMSGVYCLSGFVKTRKGKWLVFSFMHNNFKGSSKKYKEAMTPVLEWLYEYQD